MIKAVVFDGDGMVIVGEMFSRQLESDYGISASVTKEFFERDFEACVVGKKDLIDALPKYINEWGWKGTLGGLLEYWFEGNSVDEKMIQEAKRLREKGIICVLATNQEKERAKYFIQGKGLGKVFDLVICSCEVGVKKPEKKFFDKMIEKIGVSKNEVLFWDDRQECFVAAKKYGFNAELYSNITDFKNKINIYVSD